MTGLCMVIELSENAEQTVRDAALDQGVPFRVALLACVVGLHGAELARETGNTSQVVHTIRKVADALEAGDFDGVAITASDVRMVQA
jgi:hypothetical protein